MIDPDKISRNMKLINGLLFVLDLAIEAYDKSGKLRARAAKAVLDRKTIGDEELIAAEKDLRARIAAARKDN